MPEIMGRANMHSWKFNRGLLEPALQTSYDSLFRGFCERRPIADVSGTTIHEGDIATVLNAIWKDNPLLFDISITGHGIYGDGRLAYVSLGYRLSDQMYTHTVARILSKARFWLSEIDDLEGLSDMEKTEAVHDLLISKLVYRESGRINSEDDHTVVGALLMNSGVCDGIAQAASLLLNMVGVKASVVGGRIIGKEEGHAWNIVEIGGRRGHLDVGFDVIWEAPYPIYRNFLISDKEMSKSRTWGVRTDCEGFDSYYNRHFLNVSDDSAFIDAFRRERSRSNTFVLKREGRLSSASDERISDLSLMASDWVSPDEMYIYPEGEIRFVFR